MTRLLMQPKETPLSKLLTEKKRLRTQCRLQEQKLNADFSYIQENAGSLLLSGFSALLSTTGSSKSKKKNAETTSSAVVSGGQSASFGLTDALSLGSGLLPIAWEVAQPFIITWGIKRVRKLVGRFFTRKKSLPAKN